MTLKTKNEKLLLERIHSVMLGENVEANNNYQRRQQ